MRTVNHQDVVSGTELVSRFKAVKIRDGKLYSLNTSGDRISPELEYGVDMITESPTSKGVFTYDTIEDCRRVIDASDPKYRDNLPTAIIQLLAYAPVVASGYFKGMPYKGYKKVLCTKVVGTTPMWGVVGKGDLTAHVKKVNGEDAYYVEVRANGDLIFTTGMSAAHQCGMVRNDTYKVSFVPNESGAFSKYFRVLARK